MVSAAVQQVATGVAAAAPTLLISPHMPHLTLRGVMALGWLVVFGPNPVVAVILGWVFTANGSARARPALVPTATE
ncbi:MAG: hypothetical protein ABSF98_04190 [Bryobacteraceae bacterium]|jgi:hypothetical protein